MATVDLNSLYEQVYDLLEVKSDHDLVANPYKFKYAARKKLQRMKTVLSDALDKETTIERGPTIPGECSLLKAQLAAVLLQMGVIGLNTEELSTGQEHLEKVLEIISEVQLSPLCIYLAVVCHNNLALLWCQRDEQEKSHQHLIQARDCYLMYRNQNEAKPPKDIHELFNSDKPGGWNALEKMHTLTLYYLAQVKGKLGKADESAHLCLTTLHRQLDSGEYEVLSWAVNAATLAKYYEQQMKFKLARRLLAAAWTILDTTDVVAGQTENQSNHQDRPRENSETKAEVSLRWGQYCLGLLKESHDGLFQEGEGEESVEESAHNESMKTSENECLEQMEFCKLELSAVEEKVPWEKAKDYEDAKKIFMAGLRWLNDALNFYTLENHASNHTEVSQDISQLYKLLASFESNPERRCKMHKRRVDILTPILEALNAQYYLQVCRQLDFELGETYTAMIESKYDFLGSASPNPHQISKINLLVNSSIKHFENYINSFQSPSGEKPSKYPEDSVRPVLVAYFHLGRLWMKLIANPVAEKLTNMEKALENFKTMVDYCELHPSSALLISLELPVCKEMTMVLPYHIQSLKARL